MTGRVEFATSTAPLPPLADLVSNSTPPGQITREWASSVDVRLGRDSGCNDDVELDPLESHSAAVKFSRMKSKPHPNENEIGSAITYRDRQKG
jgi:hypothetical protein